MTNSNSNTDDCYDTQNNGVICYVRHWNEEQMKTIGRFIFPTSEIFNISEHKNVAQLGL